MILDLPHVRLSPKGLRLWDRMAEEIIAVPTVSSESPAQPVLLSGD
jgi:hypothetical protein